MGFLEGFIRGLTGNTNGDEIVNLYKEEDEDALCDQVEGKKTNYRDKAFENSQSVNGKYMCIRCHRYFDKGDIDIDHIIPQSKGGDSTRYNLQCMCKHCNRSKKDDTSNTNQDLRRRAKELSKQDKEDIKWINSTFGK